MKVFPFNKAKKQNEIEKQVGPKNGKKELIDDFKFD
jgi:hypothetical protein